MLPPPKYTRTAEEGAQNHNTIVDEENNDLDAPPPAYSRQGNRAPSSLDVKPDPEESSIRSDRPIVRLPPIPSSPSRLQQLYLPRTNRTNPFVGDVRAWNAFQVSNQNNSNGGARVENYSRPLGTVPHHGYRSRGDVENVHDRPALRNPKFMCKCVTQRRDLRCERVEG